MALVSWGSLTAATKSKIQDVMLFIKGKAPDADIYAVEGGQQTADWSVPVIIASDQSAIPISGSITANNDSVSATGAAVPAKATYAGLNVAGNLVGLTGTAAGLKVDGSAVTQPVSGTVTANIGTSGSLALDATVAKLNVSQGTALGSNTGPMSQASVTAAAPSYTTGQISPMSLTTAGALRTDASASTQPVSGTITANIGTAGTLALDATVTKLNVSQGTALGSNTGPMAQGSVTTAAPSYTTGQISPLSLSTAGALRTDASATTQPVSGTITANIGTSGSLALDATVAKLTISQGTALGSNTGPMVLGSVTTAAPTYTTGQISPVSLTTAGAVRVDNSGVTQTVSGTVTANAGTGTFTIDPASTNIGANGAVGSVTGSALTGSYATVVTPGFASRIVQIFNSCNNTIKVSLDGGTTDFFILEAGESPSIDLGANGRKIAASVNLQAKHNGAAPTSGTIRITAIG